MTYMPVFDFRSAMLVRRWITATAATAVAVVMTLAGAGSASASDYFYIGGSEGEVDNSPGNGAPGWIWVYAGSDYNSLDNASATLEFQLADGSSGTYTVLKDKAGSTNLWSAVWAARLCITTAYKNHYNCTEWHEYA
ncbi:hypothetical protein FNH09_02400 [Streptomyces adustus]|uniref:Uncharacterized protein n=1 Tax=Streptomyces adustus TaxID=1609272 RepID=A0A5N8V4G2_9ACTN|nr:hypothetical protein [Streptomyces adustus]MPY30200.1 hypothetical protein [Streptomyces adustus]